MKRRNTSSGNVKSVPVMMEGGLNENVSSIQLKGGELISCLNYQFHEGALGSYSSINGFERYSGIAKPSEFESVKLTISNCTVGIPDLDVVTGVSSTAEGIAIGASVLISGSYVGSDAVIEVTLRDITLSYSKGETLSSLANGTVGTLTETDYVIGSSEGNDAGVIYARDQVGEVGSGTCEGAVLGVAVFENNVYAFRNRIGGLTAGMFRSTPTGWIEIDTSANPLEPDGHYHFSEYNFLAGTDTNSLFWSDTKGQARFYDGTSITVIDNVGMSSQGLDKPTCLLAHNNHLFLSYEGGSLQFSVLGDPTIWDGVLGASEIGLGDEITGLVAGVQSSLVIMLRHGIRLLQGNSLESFTLEVFSNVSGAYRDTTQRLLGTSYFMDDRGVTNLEAVQEFGDVGSNAISQKINVTLQENKGIISAATVSRTRNQYRLFFNDGTGIYFSFFNKAIRGMTTVDFEIPVLTVSDGVDSGGDELIVFTSSDGYVYQMDSGTSFDGNEIPTKLSTAYYHYGSSRNWKKFKSIMFEITAPEDIDVLISTSFDYSDVELPRSSSFLENILGKGGAVYGSGEWGIMKWGSSVFTTRFLHYIRGLSSNMSVSLRTSSKHAESHALLNFTVDFELAGRQL
jgi:hypothetical protein